MKTRVVVLLLGILINGAASMVHTLRYFHTHSSHVPKFVSVGLVNDLQITHYDSQTKRYVPKQDWMNKITAEDPQYWDRNTQRCLSNEQWGKPNIETAKQRLNLTEGLYLWQTMYGCEWNDETDDITGYYQNAFDGEDFISLDLKTETFVAAKQQAFITKLNWERSGDAVQWKNYINNICAVFLKKHVRNGASVLKRTELPLVSLLQKSSSSPVTCHATGFYPDRAVLFWTKDGEELSENVDPGEILPNGDGTFQTSVDLDLSSVPSAGWDKYECVFQLSGVKEDHITRLDRAKIRTNEKKYTAVIAAAVAVLGAAIFAVVGFVLYRRFKDKQPTPPPSESDVRQELNPKT